MGSILLDGVKNEKMKDGKQLKKRKMPRCVYKDAFKRRFLNKVEVNDIFVKIDMYKVTSKNELIDSYNITTTENDQFKYCGEVIKKRSKSATAFDQEQRLTKTKLINLFAGISINDVWSAQCQIFDHTEEWHDELAQTIQGLTAEKAGEYIKKNFRSFGKVSRNIIGCKINCNSVNSNDLENHFELMDSGVNSSIALNDSIRNLDVNSLQFLIFNGVKYVSISK